MGGASEGQPEPLPRPVVLQAAAVEYVAAENALDVVAEVIGRDGVDAGEEAGAGGANERQADVVLAGEVRLARPGG